jgi:hypothetical protein
METKSSFIVESRVKFAARCTAEGKKLIREPSASKGRRLMSWSTSIVWQKKIVIRRLASFFSMDADPLSAFVLTKKGRLFKTPLSTR